MKAIHNTSAPTTKSKNAVISLGKYHFESNSQQAKRRRSAYTAVISLGKYHFESNSQLRYLGILRCQCCDFPRKVPFLKAIHNPADLIELNALAVISLGKYHFESNSQLTGSAKSRLQGCDFPRKVPF